MDKPIQLYLFTGFLGAGKTTFLKRTIELLKGHKIGIIMNEFGEIGVDGVLLREQGLEVNEINNGSVFCSCLKGAFVDALVTYSELPIEYLFVESSGMADPSNIEQLLREVIGNAKGKAYDYQGAICIVDANNFLEQLDVLLAIERQVLASSYIIINKIDMVDDNKVALVEEKIKMLNSKAKIVKTTQCQVDFAFIKQDLAAIRESACVDCTPKSSCNTPSNRPTAHILKIDGVFDEAKFKKFVTALIPWALRMKGFFQLSSGWHQIDIAGTHVEIKPTDIQREKSELVIISNKGLPALTQIYQQWDKEFDVDMELA